VAGTKTNTGENLKRQWQIPARQVRYREGGKWSMPLKGFPGALADENGCILFPTQEAYQSCSQNKCQICSLAVPLWDGLTYAEAHHIRPLGRPHNGPDAPTNILILCPNHHAQGDLGSIRLDLASLRCVPSHVIATEFIRYQATTIAK